MPTAPLDPAMRPLSELDEALVAANGTTRAPIPRIMTPVDSQSRIWRRRRGAEVLGAGSSIQRVPFQNMRAAPFGNPADSWSPVALRPRLATGVLLRGPAKGSRSATRIGERIRRIRAAARSAHRVMRTGLVGEGTTGRPALRPRSSPGTRGGTARMARCPLSSTAIRWSRP